jgi:hypothetical protein
MMQKGRAVQFPEFSDCVFRVYLPVGFWREDLFVVLDRDGPK